MRVSTFDVIAAGLAVIAGVLGVVGLLAGAFGGADA